MEHIQISTTIPVSPNHWEKSYEKVLPEILALEGPFLHVNLEIVGAMTRVLGVLPGIREFRGALAAMPGFDVGLLDRLEDYARAAACAHLRHTSNQPPVDQFRVVLERVVVVRERFLADVTALVQHGLLPEGVLRDLRGAKGYKNIVADLFILGDVLSRNWSAIEGKCATTLADLETARGLVAALSTLIGQREQTTNALAESADLRARAFTLFVRGYEEVRRALVFLRWWEKDASKIAPSLYANRNRRRDEDVEETETDDVDVTLPGLGDVAPGTTDGTSAPGVPVAPTPAVAVTGPALGNPFAV